MRTLDLGISLTDWGFLCFAPYPRRRSGKCCVINSTESTISRFLCLKWCLRPKVACSRSKATLHNHYRITNVKHALGQCFAIGLLLSVNQPFLYSVRCIGDGKIIASDFVIGHSLMKRCHPRKRFGQPLDRIISRENGLYLGECHNFLQMTAILRVFWGTG